eukprot:3146595-Rhodomonas_salina.3
MTGWQELAEDVGDAGERMLIASYAESVPDISCRARWQSGVDQAALVGVKRSRSRDLVRMASDGQPQR